MVLVERIVLRQWAATDHVDIASMGRGAGCVEPGLQGPLHPAAGPADRVAGQVDAGVLGAAQAVEVMTMLKDKAGIAPRRSLTATAFPASDARRCRWGCERVLQRGGLEDDWGELCRLATLGR